MSSESEPLYKSMKEMMTDISNKKCGEGSSAQHIIPSICRVPEQLRKINASAYTPGVVSIGPLHRHDKLLQRWQENKKIYMHSLLERTAKASECDENEILRRCVNAMLEAAPQARAFYAESFKDDDREFAKLMLVDGCFILEFLYRSVISDDEGNVMNPIFINGLDEFIIKYDLLLLENQIPFLVLNDLFQVTLKNILEKSLTIYVAMFVNQIAVKVFKTRDVDGIDETQCYHILDLLHKLYRPRTRHSTGDNPHSYYSATDLDRAGVNFKPSEGGDFLLVEFGACCSFPPVIKPVTPRSSSRWWLLGLLNTLPSIISQFKCRFFRTRCLRLPPLTVDDSTETFFRNLIAHEQCSDNVPKFFTSYAVLMDILIDSRKDVEVLVNAEVLKNDLGSNQDITNLFNNLCKEIIFGEFYYTKQWEELTKYRNFYWPKHIASLQRTYFGNPWTRISFCAALVLFALTAIQTGYTVKSYFSSLNDDNKN